MRVLMYAPTFERVRARLAADFPGVSVVAMDDTGALTAHLGEGLEPDVAWASSELYQGGPVRDFMVSCLKSKNLKFFQTASAGLEHPVFAMLGDNGAVIANSHANAISVAEYAVACVFDAFQSWEARREDQRAQRWAMRPGREVFGSRWVVVGLGAIGRAICLRAKALGAHVIGVRRSPHPDDPADRVVPPSALPEVVSEADVVIACAAANPDNEGMFDGQLFARMTTASVFVNVARGSLVDEAALLAALDRGAPATAYLDVFAVEPLPQASPLWSHPRVRVTGHCAGAGEGTHARNDDLFFDNLRRVRAGEVPRHVVPLHAIKAATMPSWTAK